MNDNTEIVKAGLDAVSFAAIIGTLAQWLPAIAALMSVIWFGIRIVESDLFAYLVYDWRKNWANAPVKKKDESE